MAGSLYVLALCFLYSIYFVYVLFPLCFICLGLSTPDWISMSQLPTKFLFLTRSYVGMETQQHHWCMQHIWFPTLAKKRTCQPGSEQNCLAWNLIRRIDFLVPLYRPINAAQLTDLHGTCRAAGIGVCSVTSATSRQLGEFLNLSTLFLYGSWSSNAPIATFTFSTGWLHSSFTEIVAVTENGG